MTAAQSPPPSPSPAPEDRLAVLFVCLGNICRSPMAEGVLRELVARDGLVDRVRVDSAGTGSWHVGEPADPRSRAQAARHGIELVGRGRQVAAADGEAFDLILALDAANLRDLEAALPDAAAAGRIRRLREFDPSAVAADGLDVPDPYTGGEEGFRDAYAMIERACRGLLDELRGRLAP